MCCNTLIAPKTLKCRMIRPSQISVLIYKTKSKTKLNLYSDGFSLKFYYSSFHKCFIFFPPNKVKCNSSSVLIKSESKAPFHFSFLEFNQKKSWIILFLIRPMAFIMISLITLWLFKAHFTCNMIDSFQLVLISTK